MKIISLLIPVFSVFAATTIASAETLWSLGKPDRSGKEFAFAGRYDQFPVGYAATLKTDLISVVAPADQWPYIHPGPDDRWAGSTTHPLTIGFHLEEIPRGECELIIDLVGSHALPLDLESSLNGTAARLNITDGGGDAALENESAGKPTSHRVAYHPVLLRKGRNELTLTVVSGSWLLYDAIRLEHSPDKPPRLLSVRRAEQTPFFSRGLEGLRQNLRVTVSNAGPVREILATARCGDAVVTGTLPLGHGESQLDVATPVVDEPTSVIITLSSGDDEVVHNDTLLPQRRWKLYIAPSIHTDIGYTDTQEAVFKRHNTNLDAVVELCRQNPLFKWNIEVAWEMQNYMADRPATATQALLRLIEQERVGLHAGYLNELTALLSDEAMNRYIYYATELRRRYGMDTSSAILTDVPSATWSLPSMLAASGVRFFAQGSNQTRAPILRNSGIRDPFYWEGPDGARVLMWITESYAQSIWLARAQRLPDLQHHVTSLLRPYGRDAYPYDAVYVYGAFFDNEPVDMRYGALLNEWAEKWAYPRLILSTGPEFGDYIETNYRERIPVKRGDFGGYWEDGAGSTSHETTLHMNSQRRLTAAETLWSLTRLAGAKVEIPADAFRKAWEDLLFYAEHTWGAAQSIADPDSEMTRRQWEGKAEYAHNADRDTKRLLEEGLDAFVRTVPAEPGELVVANSHSWKRSGLVALPGVIGETAEPMEIVDTDGLTVPTQLIDGGIAFYAAGVPGFGSRTYRMRPSSAAPSQTGSGASVLENVFYRVSLDQTRGVTSILDLAHGKDLVDSTSPYAMGHVVYAAGGEDTTLVMDNAPVRPEVIFNGSGAAENGLAAPAGKLLLTPARVTRIEPGVSGPIFSEAVIHSSAPSLPDIRTHVRLYHTEKRIGFDVRMTSKTEIRRKEAVYVAFPFAAKQPRFRLGMTNAVSRPDVDFPRGACHEWYCVQDFVVCHDTDAASTEQPDVLWTAIDAPLITVSQVNSGRWSPMPELTTGTLFSYVMNNYWFTNYKAGQGGDFRFRYELTSGDGGGEGEGGLMNDECLRFSRNVSTPLLAALSPGAKGQARTPHLSLAGPGVVATTLKPAEDNHGLIVRLRNATERPTTASVSLRGGTGRPMERLNLVEEGREILPTSDGRAELLLKPQQTATVRFFPD